MFTLDRRRNNKQNEVYDYIKKHILDKGFPPSVREICAGVGLSSTSTVHGHLQRLEKKGLIKRDLTKPRAIELIKEKLLKTEMIDIPVIGKVTAGLPILAVENIEDTFSIPMNFIKNNCQLFALNVTGQSMIEAGINSGDLAIIEQTSSAENGEIVVALIDNEATLKRFYKEENHIRLQPENKTMDPIIVDDCSILGKLVGIFRKY